MNDDINNDGVRARRLEADTRALKEVELAARWMREQKGFLLTSYTAQAFALYGAERVEDETRELREQLEWYVANFNSQQTLIGKIQSAVESAYPGGREADYDVLDQGVRRLVTERDELREALKEVLEHAVIGGANPCQTGTRTHLGESYEFCYQHDLSDGIVGGICPVGRARNLLEGK